MSKKSIRIGLIFGGTSLEHEVSIMTAKGVQNALSEYDIKLLYITKENRAPLRYLLENDFLDLDLIFPLIHGPIGEDGTLQGLLELSGIPYVGSDVLSSAICMDKIVSKTLLKAKGFPIGNFLFYSKHEKIDLDHVVKTLSFPCFVKPANLGSSLGISKVYTLPDLEEAIDLAFTHDSKILIEEMINGMEAEISVLGNEDPIVSLPGEIVSKNEFYDYNAKYIEEDGATFHLPARLPQSTILEMQILSREAYLLLGCSGLARIDFLVGDKPYISEINTLPGFTPISLYPKLWQLEGIEYPDLIDRLIQLAFERHSSKVSVPL